MTSAALALPRHIRRDVFGRLLNARPLAWTWPERVSDEDGSQSNAPAPAPAVELSDVSLSIGDVAALKNVSFSIARGEIVSVIGPHGAGKSALIDVISGVRTPHSGQTLIDGEPLDPAAATPREVARTFQTLSPFTGLDVASAVASGVAYERRAGVFGTLFGGAEKREAAADASRVEEVVAFFDLARLARKPVSALSGAVRKRVELACALAGRPRLVLLEEPLAGMNEEERHEMLSFICAARDEWDATVILTQVDAMRTGLSDRVVALDRGSVAAIGTPAAVRADQKVAESYLRAAYGDDPAYWEAVRHGPA